MMFDTYYEAFLVDSGCEKRIAILASKKDAIELLKELEKRLDKKGYFIFVEQNTETELVFRRKLDVEVEKIGLRPVTPLTIEEILHAWSIADTFPEAMSDDL